MEKRTPSDCPATDEPAGMRLARLLDQEIPARLPRVLSGPRSQNLSELVEQSIAILHRQQPRTRFVIFSPGHPEGVLAALAEAIEALHPALTRRRLRQTPVSGWPGAIQKALLQGSTADRYVMVVDPLQELWEPQVRDQERPLFLHQLTCIAGLRSIAVLFVLDANKLEHCRRSRLLQPSLNSRFHLHLGGGTPRFRMSPPPVPAPERLSLQPIRPRGMRPTLPSQRPMEEPCPAMIARGAPRQSPA